MRLSSHFKRVRSDQLDAHRTLFSLSQYNTTSDDEAVEYIRSNYFPHATPAEIALLRTHYDPADIAAGSPFDTGMRNVVRTRYSLDVANAHPRSHQLYPAYKFIAAVQGECLTPLDFVVWGIDVCRSSFV